MLPNSSKGKARADRCIPKVSEQLQDLLECNNRLRLWIISFSFSSIKYFLVRCLLDFETSLRFDERVMLP